MIARSGDGSPADMLAAVISQAVHDYKRLCDLGYIKNRGFSGLEPKKSGHCYYGYRCRRDVELLCTFFWSEELEDVLNLGLIDVDADAIRRGLDEYERAHGGK